MGRDQAHPRTWRGNTIRVDFEYGNELRTTRKEAVTCDWCGAVYPEGSDGPTHRPRTALWRDAPEVT